MQATLSQRDFLAALLAAEITPYALGAYHAERGIVADPTIYASEGDRLAYEEGYADALAALEAQRTADLEATIDAVFAPVVDERQLAFDLLDYEAEADEYADDILDREFWARGLW